MDKLQKKKNDELLEISYQQPLYGVQLSNITWSHGRTPLRKLLGSRGAATRRACHDVSMAVKNF
jgi:hypothetical protein